MVCKSFIVQHFETSVIQMAMNEVDRQVRVEGLMSEVLQKSVFALSSAMTL